MNDKEIVLYSISSILGKEFKVYSREKEVNIDYFLLIDEDQEMSSFIDCTKAYKLSLTTELDITKLSHRSMPEAIRKRIMSKINDLKNKGKHTEYCISTEEFIFYNPKAKIK